MNYDEEFIGTYFPLLELAAQGDIYYNFTPRRDRCLMNFLNDGA